MNLADVQAFALDVWKVKQAELVAFMLCLGDRLDIFGALAEAGPSDSTDLAAATGLAERPLREWLYGMAAADMLGFTDGAFSIPDAAVPVLVDENTSPFYAAGAFAMLTDDQLEPTLGLMRTGFGGGFDAIGSHSIDALERMTGPSHRIILAGLVLPAIGADLERLASIADLGCGTGLSTEVIAASAPNARVVGIDPSSESIARANDRSDDRVGFVEDYAENLPELGTFDLITALDCLHDMPRPDLALSACRQALGTDGIMLVKEPRSTGDFDRDRKNPLLALNYGFSLTGCLHSALSTEDGWGLGNTGLYPDRLEALALECGFGEVRHLDIPDPAATYSVLR